MASGMSWPKSMGSGSSDPSGMALREERTGLQCLSNKRSAGEERGENPMIFW